MKFLLLIIFALTTSTLAGTLEIYTKQLSSLTYIAVTRTDTYWDGGSIGIKLTSDNGQIFEVRTLNPKLSPQQRTLIFSVKSDRKALAIPINSDLEKELIRLLKTQPKNDSRGVEIADNLLKTLIDRNTPWESSRWYTLEYLKEHLQKSLSEKYMTESGPRD